MGIYTASASDNFILAMDINNNCCVVYEAAVEAIEGAYAKLGSAQRKMFRLGGACSIVEGEEAYQRLLEVRKCLNEAEALIAIANDHLAGAFADAHRLKHLTERAIVAADLSRHYRGRAERLHLFRCPTWEPLY
jgi:hypothetical protein